VHLSSEWVVLWYYSQLCTTLHKLADNIVLHTSINSNDLYRISLPVHNGFLCADFVHNIDQIQIYHFYLARSFSPPYYFNSIIPLDASAFVNTICDIEHLDVFIQLPP
jgi:hypothetical protein